MRVKCQNCGFESEFSPLEWRCPCGGVWEPAAIPQFIPPKIRENDYSIWRYGTFLGLDIQTPLMRMGVGWTPLVPVTLHHRKVHLKLEFLSPSGSFKDRGVNAMINQLVYMEVNTVIEDSSGNAGASLAAHAARFGIKSEIFVPDYASEAKINQIRIYGAKISAIPGLRKAAEEAAQAAVEPSRVYASHAYNPAYLLGQMTTAYETWEQLGRKAPDWVICPVGQGGLFLGFWFGFRQLQQAGLINHMPRMVATQPTLNDPVHKAWTGGLEHIPPIVGMGQTLAEGVAISKPVRDQRILQALRETNGKTVAISEEEILEAQHQITRMGYFIEPTSALVTAGLAKINDEIEPDAIVILPLTGSGLKGLPKHLQ